MLEPEDCPTAEEMATFVEGVDLDGGWQHFIAHLSRCPACRAVLTESRKLRREHRKEESDPGS